MSINNKDQNYSSRLMAKYIIIHFVNYIPMNRYETFYI